MLKLTRDVATGTSNATTGKERPRNLRPDASQLTADTESSVEHRIDFNPTSWAN